MSTPAIAFVGHHNAGKTTLVEKVIERLSARGLRVGSIKHHGVNDQELDLPNSDVFHHVSSGSVHTIMVSPHAVADYSSVAQEPSFYEVLARLHDVDIVIVEGYKHARIPSIAVARSQVDSFGTLLTLLSPTTIAVTCDDTLAPTVPEDLKRYSLDDIDGIVELVMRTAKGR